MNNDYDRIIEGDEVKTRQVVRTGDFYDTDGGVKNIEELYNGGGGGGTDDHRRLSHRNDPNQHNMASITGLDDKLAEVDQEIEDLQNHPLGNEESLFVDFGYQTDTSQPSSGYIIRVNKPASNFKYNDRIRIVGNKQELVAKVMSVAGGTMAFLTIDVEITPYGIAMRQPVYLFKRTFTLDDAKAVLEATGQEFGTKDHNELYNRDLEDQHPISAVSGLSDALEEMSDDIDTKVTQLPGYGLSQANFTPAEKEKLAQVDGPLWLGRYVSVAQLEAAHPANTAPDGARAYVDSGPDGTAREYIVDRDEPMRWVPAGETSGTETPASVLEKLLENPDTNVLTDLEKEYVDNLPYVLPKATETSLGGVEIATQAEVRDRRDAAKVITPARISDAFSTEKEIPLLFNNFNTNTMMGINTTTVSDGPLFDIYNETILVTYVVHTYGMVGTLRRIVQEATLVTPNPQYLKYYNKIFKRSAYITPPETTLFWSSWEELPNKLPALDGKGYIMQNKNWVEVSGLSKVHNDLTGRNALNAHPISSITDLDDLIPNQAVPVTNELADKQFVNSSIQNMAANYVSIDAGGNPFPTRASIQNATIFYSHGAVYTPSINDYAVVLNDEGAPSPYTNMQARWVHDGVSLKYRYSYSVAFTAAEQAALDSGITATKVEEFNNKVSFPEAPNDGKQYARNGLRKEWQEVQGGPGGGIPEPPNDRKLYGRMVKNSIGNWEEIKDPKFIVEGLEFTARQTPVGNNWLSVCWSPELMLFCAVANTGTGNRVMTSPDGINWTMRTTSVDNAWQSVCWSPELSLFCAVSSTAGTNNNVMTSPDGINWTIRSTPVDNVWYSVCWSPELSLFCAVAQTGTGNRVMTSPDGINWTIRTSAANNNWYSVCWSPELMLFCAVASSGTGNRVMTSPDGINWVLRTSAVDNTWRSVCWSPELSLFCAVASSGTGNRVMTSPDGINWALRTSAVDNNWYSVCWSPELSLFCAVAQTGTGNRVMTSTDGINWVLRTSAVDNGWRSVCWSPELMLFCAVANSGTGNKVMTGAIKVYYEITPDHNSLNSRSEPDAHPISAITDLGIELGAKVPEAPADGKQYARNGQLHAWEEVQGVVPIGSTIFHAGKTPPPGYLVRDGSLVSRTTYANLFNIIGTLYGIGDGSTTFQLPDDITDELFVRAGSANDVGKAEGDSMGDGGSNILPYRVYLPCLKY